MQRGSVWSLKSWTQGGEGGSYADIYGNSFCKGPEVEGAGVRGAARKLEKSERESGSS